MTIRKHSGRVLRHENGGVTIIQVTDWPGCALREVPMPTECIPIQLRPIGSQIRFTLDLTLPEASATADELRAHFRTSFRVIQSGETE